jgi:two-component sensor histidine kinase
MDHQRPVWDCLELLPARVAVFDDTGHLLFANGAWRAPAPGDPCGLLDTQDLSAYVDAHAEGSPAGEIATGFDRAVYGRQESFDAACQAPGAEHTCRVRVVARRMGLRRVLVVTHDDLTDQRRAEQALQRVVADRERLLREVHHRVKNNLQIISSLLALQLRTLDSEAARRMAADMRMRVRTIAGVHERLCDSGDLAHLDLGEYIRSLVPGITSGLTPEGTDLDLSVATDTVVVGLDEAVRCGLIVNELVSNALEHAFLGRAHGRLRVELRRVDAGHAALVVADDGVGMAESIDPARAQSLGLHLVAGLAQRLGGAVEVTRGAGTTFRLVIVTSPES